MYGAGKLFFALEDGPVLLASMEVGGADSWFRGIAARMAFASFLFGKLRDEYLKPFRAFYDTSYENLVLSGKLRREGSTHDEPFFLVSGVHDRDFPWGDGELFR